MLYYRKLSRADVPKIEAHFLRLSPADRRRRFHSQIDDDAVRAYCRSFRWSERAVIGACHFDRLIALAEAVRVAPDRAEIAVSVDAGWRHLGVGRELVRRAAASAGNSGMATAVLDYTPGDAPIPHIARALGGDVDAAQAVAQLNLPAQNAAGQIEELVEDIGAALAWAFETALWPLRVALGAPRATIDLGVAER